MTRRKPSYANENLKKLQRLCNREGYEIERKSPDQYRVYGATHVIDFWIARMKYHKLLGEDINSNEPYNDTLQWQFDEKQVAHLLATGEEVR